VELTTGTSLPLTGIYFCLYLTIHADFSRKSEVVTQVPSQSAYPRVRTCNNNCSAIPDSTENLPWSHPELTYLCYQTLDNILSAKMANNTCPVWDVKLCSPFKVNRRFGGIRRLYFRGQRISQARNLASATCFHAGSSLA
jgi:hypothetical protein